MYNQFLLMPRRKRLDPEILEAALEGFALQRRRVDEQIAELRAMLAGQRTPATVASVKPRKRRRSAAARKRMSEAQKKRWAKLKEANKPTKKASKKAAKR